MPYILIYDEWEQRVRDKLGVDIEYLPDSAIRQPDIIDTAEANIITQIPDYATLEDEPDAVPPTFKRTWLEAATVCECAVLLCPSMAARLPSLSQGPHARFEIGVNWDRKKRELAEERDSYIGKILDSATDSTTVHYHFGLTKMARRCRR